MSDMYPQTFYAALTASRLSDGRFYRRWPEEYKAKMPKCAVGGEIPGLFEVTLPDIRPTLRRYDS